MGRRQEGRPITTRYKAISIFFYRLHSGSLDPSRTIRTHSRYFSRRVRHHIADSLAVPSALRKKSRFGDVCSIQTFADCMALRILEVMHTWYVIHSPTQTLCTAEVTNTQVSHWMDHGNAISYVQNHTDVDRLRLLSEVASGVCHNIRV